MCYTNLKCIAILVEKNFTMMILIMTSYNHINNHDYRKRLNHHPLYRIDDSIALYLKCTRLR